MGNPYPMEFVQVGRDIELRFEEFDALRKIHMGAGVARPTDVPLSPLGYSVGRWEGKTLVVDTSRINWPYFDRSGAPQTQNVTINERFTVVPDGSRLDYVMTVNEPAIARQAVRLERVFRLESGRSDQSLRVHARGVGVNQEHAQEVIPDDQDKGRDWL